MNRLNVYPIYIYTCIFFFHIINITKNATNTRYTKIWRLQWRPNDRQKKGLRRWRWRKCYGFISHIYFLSKFCYCFAAGDGRPTGKKKYSVYIIPMICFFLCLFFICSAQRTNGWWIFFFILLRYFFFRSLVLCLNVRFIGFNDRERRQREEKTITLNSVRSWARWLILWL